MQRALLPYVLASLGYVLSMWALTMPLFEWKIDAIQAKYPPDYNVYLSPSPWITKLGESLDDSSYFFHKIFISVNQATCLNEEGLNIVAERSPRDKKLELLSVWVNTILLWLPFLSLILIILSVIYMWWGIIWREQRPISEAIVPTIITAFFFCALVGILRLLGPNVAWDFFNVSYECSGALNFHAALSRIHYGMPIVLFIGLFAELGAFGIILYEMFRTTIQGHESSKTAVG